MPKVLIAYASMTGNTEKMARYIAEGVRISGCEAVVKNISKIKEAGELEGFDGYIFGSPTYYRDMAGNMKTFLFLGRKVELAGKLAGAFGSYTHDGGAAGQIMETVQHVFEMEPFELGPFSLKEAVIDAQEGLRACQDYGRVFGEKLQ